MSKKDIKEIWVSQLDANWCIKGSVWIKQNVTPLQPQHLEVWSLKCSFYVPRLSLFICTIRSFFSAGGRLCQVWCHLPVGVPGILRSREGTDRRTDGRWWSTGVMKKGFDPVSLILFVTVTTAQPSCNTIRHAANSAHVLTHYGAHTSRSEGPLIPSRLHSCCTARSSPPAHVWPGGKKRTRLPG